MNAIDLQMKFFKEMTNRGYSQTQIADLWAATQDWIDAPSELLKQRDELLEVMKESSNFLQQLVHRLPACDWRDGANAGIEKMNNIIQSITKEQ